MMQSGMDLFYAGFGNELPPPRCVFYAIWGDGGAARSDKTSGAEICVGVCSFVVCRVAAIPYRGHIRP